MPLQTCYDPMRPEQRNPSSVPMVKRRERRTPVQRVSFTILISSAVNPYRR